MKKFLYLLLPFFIISCSGEENTEPTVIAQSYSAEIGDLITISGTNLGEIKNIRILSENYVAPGITIYHSPGAALNHPFFKNQTDTEIQFILPELYTESYVMHVGNLQIPFNIKGFIPLNDVLNMDLGNVSGIRIINEDMALARLNNDLYLLENGYYKSRKISSNVQFFGTLKNEDSWYVTTSNSNTYNIFYSSAGSLSYNQIATLQRSDLDISDPYLNDIIITPEKQIYISTTMGVFLLKNGEIKKDIELFPGLDAYPLEQRAPLDLRLAPDGIIYGQLDFRPLNGSSPQIGFLILDPKNNTFAFSEKYTANIEGPGFSGQTGYFYLPLYNHLYKSLDSGMTWSESPTPPDTPEGSFRSAKLSVMDANTVFIFIHRNIDGEMPDTSAYLSKDGGITWNVRKRFNFPKEKNKWVGYSAFSENSGLIYLTDFTNRSRLYKYVH